MDILTSQNYFFCSLRLPFLCPVLELVGKTPAVQNYRFAAHPIGNLRKNVVFLQNLLPNTSHIKNMHCVKVLLWWRLSCCGTWLVSWTQWHGWHGRHGWRVELRVTAKFRITRNRSRPTSNYYDARVSTSVRQQSDIWKFTKLKSIELYCVFFTYQNVSRSLENLFWVNGHNFLWSRCRFGFDRIRDWWDWMETWHCCLMTIWKREDDNSDFEGFLNLTINIRQCTMRKL